MDFEDTPEEAAFRHEVTAWLAEQAAEYDLSRHGDITMEQQLALGRAFQARKAERGYAKVTWPRHLGVSTFRLPGLKRAPQRQLLLHSNIAMPR